MKLERKAEDRKVSLKQLFGILTTKEKELDLTKNSIESIKIDMERKTSKMVFNITYQKNRVEDNISIQERKIFEMADKLHMFHKLFKSHMLRTKQIKLT